MVDPRRNSFDFREDDMRGDQYQPARPPSATASSLRDTTQSALSGARRPINSAVNPFTQPNPYPSAPQAPRRTGPNVAFIGGNPNDPVTRSRAATADLFEQARSTNNLADRSALLREAMASADFDRSALDAQTTTSEGRLRRGAAADIANLGARVDTGLAERREATALALDERRSSDTRYGVDTRDARSAANAELSASTSRANTLDNILSAELRDAADLDIRERTLAQSNTGSYTLDSHFGNMGVAFTAGSPEELASLKAAYAGARTEGERAVIRQMITAAGAAAAQQDVPGGYEGGLVTPVGFASGGIVPPGSPAAPPALAQTTPQMPDPALVARYTQYAEGSKAMGLNTVGFEEFSRMAQGAQAVAGSQPAPSGAGAPVAMAEGGVVPGESGQMVIDSDPAAPTDSIPAVIDGQTPAKLDSGELIFPRHAVLYYGTDKLNKMIAKSKEAQEGGNGESATGLNS